VFAYAMAKSLPHDEVRALTFFTLIGINAFTFNIILGAAILAAMIFNIHVGRIRRRGAR